MQFLPHHCHVVTSSPISIDTPLSLIYPSIPESDAQSYSIEMHPTFTPERPHHQRLRKNTFAFRIFSFLSEHHRERGEMTGRCRDMFPGSNFEMCCRRQEAGGRRLLAAAQPRSHASRLGGAARLPPCVCVSKRYLYRPELNSDYLDEPLTKPTFFYPSSPCVLTRPRREPQTLIIINNRGFVSPHLDVLA